MSSPPPSDLAGGVCRIGEGARVDGAGYQVWCCDDEEGDHEGGGEERGRHARAGVEVWWHGGVCIVCGGVWWVAREIAEASRGLSWCVGERRRLAGVEKRVSRANWEVVSGWRVEVCLV